MLFPAHLGRKPDPAGLLGRSDKSKLDRISGGGNLSPVELIDQDLNSLTTVSGYYHQNSSAMATPERNYPVQLAGGITVLAVNTKTYQYFTVYKGAPSGQGGDTYVRARDAGGWGSWRKFAFA